MLKKTISLLCAFVLTISLCPVTALADTETGTNGTVESGSDVEPVIGENNVSSDGADSDNDRGNEADIDEGDERNDGGEINEDASSEESSEDVVSSGESLEEDASIPSDGESSGMSENSWRFENGRLITSSEGASTEGEIATFGLTTNPDGYKVFNWFDGFSSGYCSGNGASRVIDVSEHNGSIDWAKVKASGVDYAIIRCGYGSDGYYNQDDKRWIENVRGCLANGIEFGIYLYSYATNTTMAKSEADHVLRQISAAGLDASDVKLPVYFDMEDSSTIGSDYAAIAKAFCSKIQSAGYGVGVYASKNWWETRLTDACFNSWSKWVAEWNASQGLTYSGLSDFESGNGMWQFSDYGSVPGISSAVDLNYTYMKVEDVTVSPGAQTVADGTYEVVSKLSSSKVLDVDSASTRNGANVQLYSSNGSAAQRFKFTYDGAGFYMVTCVASGKVLDVESASARNGANVQQYQSNGTDAQKWRVDKNSDGTYTLTCKASGKVLDVDSASTRNGANVQQYAPNGTDAQKFKLKAA